MHRSSNTAEFTEVIPAEILNKEIVFATTDIGSSRPYGEKKI